MYAVYVLYYVYSISYKEMLTEKQQKEFIEWYLNRYYPNGCDDRPYPIPHIDVAKKEEEIEAWRTFLEKLIWPRKAKAIYKIRPYWPETVLHKVFSSLWLQYWPIFDWETWTDVYNTEFNF